ncbi:MAG: T9SS type A sorting domain-containing protein, partial [Bacteroidota bacterium]
TEEEEEEEEEEVRLAIRIFPNPTQNKELTIEMKETGFYTVRIFDLLGKQVDQFFFDGIDYPFIGDHLSTGIYILEIQYEEEILFREKLMIQ